MNHDPRPILLIQPAHAHGGLTDHFTETKQPWVRVQRFTEAAQAARQQDFGMVVCDWELFQVLQADQFESACCANLLRETSSLIFLSSNQSVAVNFKPLMGRSFYSLRATESTCLFDIIAELSTRVPENSELCLAATRKEVDNAAKSQPAPVTNKPYLPAPHFSLGQAVHPALANSAVHSLS